MPLSHFLDYINQTPLICTCYICTTTTLFFCDMTSNCCRDKAVVVVVYAERPREKRGGRRRNVDGRVKGYNRRAELLDYAKHLRAPAPQSHPSSHIKQTQVLAADGARKQNRPSSPTCFDNWSLVVTRFLRSMTAPKTSKDKGKKNHKGNASTNTKMKALVNSFQIKKRGSFVSKLLAALHKRR